MILADTSYYIWHETNCRQFLVNKLCRDIKDNVKLRIASFKVKSLTYTIEKIKLWFYDFICHLNYNYQVYNRQTHTCYPKGSYPLHRNCMSGVALTLWLYFWVKGKPSPGTKVTVPISLQSLHYKQKTKNALVQKPTRQPQKLLELKKNYTKFPAK